MRLRGGPRLPHGVLPSANILREALGDTDDQPWHSSLNSISGSAMDTVGSGQTQIWPYPSFYLRPKSKITPKAHSLLQVSCIVGRFFTS